MGSGSAVAPPPAKRVVYLFGAGASHACVKSVRSAHGILMSDLGQELSDRIHRLYKDHYADDVTLGHLVNTAISESTDFEHIITFLDGASCASHRAFAAALRDNFEDVLSRRLDAIEEEFGAPPTFLYEVLLDLHTLPGLGETVAGLLTLNYDEYLEHAIEQVTGQSVDFGVRVDGGSQGAAERMVLLKLHGSFGWRDEWPIERQTGKPHLWIPPGIEKAKTTYPFSALWARAREVLDCDIVRVVGCRLSPNDWDLIALLFSSRFANRRRPPFTIEVIDAPLKVEELRRLVPYLELKSILESELVGSQLVGEFLGSEPCRYDVLSDDDRKKVLEQAGWGHNWFRLWLKQSAEVLLAELGELRTSYGRLERLVEEY